MWPRSMRWSVAAGLWVAEPPDWLWVLPPPPDPALRLDAFRSVARCPSLRDELLDPGAFGGSMGKSIVMLGLRMLGF
ncbi:hypothetical protein C8R47DRAFT_1149334 [Mycena vitilis]|nr:hypothetical protein C8R47DRAFT_1149334 [Mycena vitilis]